MYGCVLMYIDTHTQTPSFKLNPFTHARISCIAPLLNSCFSTMQESPREAKFNVLGTCLPSHPCRLSVDSAGGTAPGGASLPSFWIFLPPNRTNGVAKKSQLSSRGWVSAQAAISHELSHCWGGGASVHKLHHSAHFVTFTHWRLLLSRWSFNQCIHTSLWICLIPSQILGSSSSALPTQTVSDYAKSQVWRLSSPLHLETLWTGVWMWASFPHKPCALVNWFLPNSFNLFLKSHLHVLLQWSVFHLPNHENCSRNSYADLWSFNSRTPRVPS